MLIYFIYDRFRADCEAPPGQEQRRGLGGVPGREPGLADTQLSGLQGGGLTGLPPCLAGLRGDSPPPPQQPLTYFLCVKISFLQFTTKPPPGARTH